MIGIVMANKYERTALVIGEGNLVVINMLDSLGYKITCRELHDSSFGGYAATHIWQDEVVTVDSLREFLGETK